MNYPKEQRSKITKLDISNQNLERDIDLIDFTNLKKINIVGNRWLGEIKENAKTIVLGSLCLEFKPDKLVINNYPVLGEIRTFGEIKNITEVSIINCPRLKKAKLREFDCENNQLTNMDFSGLEKLTYVNLNNNNFSQQDLTIFSQLANLEELQIGNDGQEKVNWWTGSLEPLKYCYQLKKLNIKNTDLNSGVEYLPISLKELENMYKAKLVPCFLRILAYLSPSYIEHDDLVKIKDLYSEKIGYSTKERPESKIREIAKQLDLFTKEYHNWAELEIGFSPNELNYVQGDYFFATHLKKEKELNPQNITLRQKWEEKGFNQQQVETLIKNGLKPNDYDYAKWLEKKRTLLLEILRKIFFINTVEWYREEYKKVNSKYGLCKQCREPHTEGRKEFLGQALIDIFFGAKLIRSIMDIFHIKLKVVLKSLNSSRENITDDFLEEIANHRLVDSRPDSRGIVPFYGISRDPKTGDYLMVMEYVEDGDLRQFSKDILINADLSIKIEHLFSKIVLMHELSKGLKLIHDRGLMHRDFHPGNILCTRVGKSFGGFFCTHASITDLGLCRPANETNKENVYGVLPYVAPEVLQGQPYTQASDIYSFGIIAYEIFANAHPYPEMDDLDLALKICQGLRPNLDTAILPQLLKDLIKRCRLMNECGTDSEFSRQQSLMIFDLSLMEKENNNNNDSSNSIHHPQIVYRSRLLLTKQIAQLLQNSQEINTSQAEFDILKGCGEAEETSKALENYAEPQWVKEKVATGEVNLDELRQAYQEELQTQIEISPIR
ncbi:20010_t:CDS:10 [Racocetra fulgida]|uniref:20010_t:CDS:1 n=1 Tax=Racocetra fulgida TaxID=60492 RepID=A0A9N9B5S9_9GLOM|nr:20010_t:CDS:10 [Racocetra fulgida]